MTSHELARKFLAMPDMPAGFVGHYGEFVGLDACDVSQQLSHTREFNRKTYRFEDSELFQSRRTTSVQSQTNQKGVDRI